MDGYAICMDQSDNLTNIDRHATNQSGLIRALEDSVPPGSRVVGIVLNDSVIQKHSGMHLVA